MNRRQFCARVAALAGTTAAVATPPLARAQDGRYPGAGPGHFIQQTREGGRFLLLEDKSLWEVAERDRYVASGWQELEGITVRFAAGDPPFPYELSNTDRDEGVAARWVRPSG